MDGAVTEVDRTPAAPALVRDYVNTIDHDLGTDELATPAGLTGFLADRGLLSGSSGCSAEVLAEAVRLRGVLHDALKRNHDSERVLLPALDEALANLPVRLAHGEDGVVVVPGADGVTGGLVRVALAAHEAQAAGTWWRLKVCALDECEWAYYDQSKNRSRSYCEYGCGNKLKTRAYRARQRAR